jgi:chromosome segregation ATPase
MKKRSFHCQFLLGLLVGGLLIPLQPVQAQWTVYDPAQYVLQADKKIEEAARWVEHYQKLVEQLTTLKGVLGKAEDLVGKENATLATMANIGRTVRASFQLKDQLEVLVTTRLNAIKRIDDRLRNGIFDPEQDMRDLDDYLQNSIGRTSQDMLANRERLARMDNKLERLILELKKAEKGLTDAEMDQEIAKQKLDEQERAPATEQSAQAMTSLLAKISNCDLLIAHYTKEIARLQEEIKDRVKQYNIRMEERVKFGEQVKLTNKAWSDFNNALDRLQRTLSKID